MSFIKTVFLNDIRRVESGRPVQARVQNVAWPSEAMAQLGQIPVGECKRAMFYKIVGVKPTNPFSVTGQAICDAGLMYEKYHISKYKEAGIHVEEQVKIEYVTPKTTNKIIISGKGDEVISHAGKLKMIELKSVSAWKAPAIMGNDRTKPMPAPNNLMQAMLYKYFYSRIEEGKTKGIDEVYLQYVNRSDNSTFFYKIDLTKNNYAIITAIDAYENEVYTTNLENVPSYTDLYNSPGVSTPDEGRQAGLRISVNDVFEKFDNTYSHARQELIPSCDYSLVYSQEELELQHKLGRISQTKYNKMKKGTDVYGDFKCQYCAFQKHCAQECGLSLS